MGRNQYYSTIKYLFFFFLLLAFSQNGTAQIIKGKKNKFKAAEHIVALKEGTLVVLLPLKHKNLLAIEKALKDKSLSTIARGRLMKKRNKILTKQKWNNKLIVDALWNYYDFSDFRILHDTAMVHVLTGKTSGYFLNDKMKIDSSITIDYNVPIYSLRFGRGSVSETNNFEGFIVRDINNEQPPKPFPYYVKAKYPPVSFFDAFIGKGGDVSPDFPSMIIKLDSNFKNYYADAAFNIDQQELLDELEKGEKEPLGKKERAVIKRRENER